MDVFSAFAGAVISGTYSIGTNQRGSLVGSVYSKVNDLDVIVDEGDIANIGLAPNAEALDADLIMYCKPEQMPTTNTRALAAGYMIHDSDTDDYFAIVNAGIGKNQETGEIEHIELMLQQTDAEFDDSESSDEQCYC
jgi:hypothetical protein